MSIVAPAGGALPIRQRPADDRRLKERGGVALRPLWPLGGTLDTMDTLGALDTLDRVDTLDVLDTLGGPDCDDTLDTLQRP